MKLADPIQKIPSIGPKYATTLESIGIETIRDIIEYYPRAYFDSSVFSNIADLSHEEKRSFVAIVKDLKSVRTRRRNFTIQTAILEDETESIEAIWFNQPFLKNSLEVDSKYIFSGKLNPKSYKPQVQSPQFEEIKEVQTHLGRITPIYPLTEGVSEKWLRSKIKWLIDKINYIDDLDETLPAVVIEKFNLMPRKEALTYIHFPEGEDVLKGARRRLGFEELFQIQKKSIKQQAIWAKYNAPKLSISKKELGDFIHKLKFQLTPDQHKVIEEIRGDLVSGKPMNRLLSGDVGSGKTIVAIVTSLIAAKNGYQAIILAPTTILAQQHYNTICSLIDPKQFHIELVTSGNDNNSEEAEESLPDIIIGTHAIFHQKEKLIKKLGVLIIDEQHRFGVEQRRNLKEIQKTSANEYYPHVLDMTATPIPRTLAMTLFSDIDLSTIRSKPSNRKPTKTHLVPQAKRESALEWIKQQTKAGVQVFWIAPLIETNEALAAKSVQALDKELKDALPELKIEHIHGKMKPEEKKKVLHKFKNYQEEGINILIATSVVEVGIDIPNANIIVIEGAERFGLAQLHQLRGRVGRSDQQAYCFLFTTNEPSEEQLERLRYFVKTLDGFELAEFDLKSRGPGEVYGVKQSGIPDLKIANIFDIDLVKETREAARITLQL